MAATIRFVLAALMDSVTDKFGATYTVTRTPWGEKVTIYHVHSGSALVARAVLRGDQVR